MDDAGEDFDPSLMQDLELETSVAFLYETMLRRDPNKRRVKPVQPHLLQLDFGGGDSSDDSDYELKKSGKHGKEALGSHPGMEYSEGESSEGSDDVDDDDDGDSDSDEESGSSNDDDENGQNSASPMDVEVVSLDSNSQFTGDFNVATPSNTVALSNAPSEETVSSSVGSSKRMKITICTVCLGDSNEDDDEIVECDSCGISVHEGCYGITDVESVASTVSSASTEPWFCDACKAGVKPHCELCPNSGGIYKETDAGKWVHLACALYIPGVAFGDVDKLTPVTLFEMPYSKWGAKDCTLCEDDRFSRTGVCIGCDAGMCRTYFHVTCAQKEGLLSEASPDEDIADPFFAYCKQHAEKSVARAKKRNFLAIQSRMKERGELHANGESKEMARVQRKLERHQKKYQAGLATRPPNWVPPEKMPRMLFSSPFATRKLLKKAELLGITEQAQNHSSEKDIRKKWHVPPALSVDFIGYFLDRNERMKSMKSRCKELTSLRDKLQSQEKALRNKYDKLLHDTNEIKEANANLQDVAKSLWDALSGCAGRKLKTPEILSPAKLTVTAPKNPSKKPAKTPVRKNQRSPTSCGIGGVIHQCNLCHKTNDQHLLAHCDTCRYYYHLGCLDPPLTRMPKKTKLFGWQCSECASSGSEDSDDPDIDPNAPRKLREKIKEPMKFSPTLLKMHERRRSEVTKGLLQSWK